MADERPDDGVERNYDTQSPVRRVFSTIAARATHAAGSVWAFGVAALVVITWAVTGPVFGFTDTWQLVINTGTTIVTFLMVFLIQHSQNKDTQALQLKLNELSASLEGASNRLIDIEDLTEDELTRLHAHYRDLADKVREGRYQDGAGLRGAEPPMRDRKGPTVTDRAIAGVRATRDKEDRPRGPRRDAGA